MRPTTPHLRSWRPAALMLIGMALLGATLGEASAGEAKVSAAEEPPVIGWVENVRLMEAGVEHKARIDTGAGLASVDATIVRIIKSDKPPQPDRVVFNVDDGKGGSKTLEKDIVQWINIKKKGGKGYIPRPVVKMEICIADRKLNARVNLAERHGFLYPVLKCRTFWLIRERPSHTIRSANNAVRSAAASGSSH
jgi:hypothetical protein